MKERWSVKKNDFFLGGGAKIENISVTVLYRAKVLRFGGRIFFVDAWVLMLMGLAARGQRSGLSERLNPRPITPCRSYTSLQLQQPCITEVLYLSVDRCDKGANIR